MAGSAPRGTTGRSALNSRTMLSVSGGATMFISETIWSGSMPPSPCTQEFGKPAGISQASLILLQVARNADDITERITFGQPLQNLNGLPVYMQPLRML